MTFDGERKEGAMTTLGKTLKRLRILRKELAGIGFELTIGKSEYLDEAASVDTPGDVFHETGRLWPVADAHGATVLFGSKDAADLYAAEHDATVGAPMSTMKSAALWSAARMTLAADGRTYEVSELPDAERRTGAKRPGARVRGALTMEALAKTPEDALALADRTGRATVRMAEKGLAPNLVAGRLVYHERRWMEEDL